MKNEKMKNNLKKIKTLKFKKLKNLFLKTLKNFF